MSDLNKTTTFDMTGGVTEESCNQLCDFLTQRSIDHAQAARKAEGKEPYSQETLEKVFGKIFPDKPSAKTVESALHMANTSLAQQIIEHQSRGSE